MSATPRMTIGVLAERTRVGVETLRYYERERLLPAPARTSAGYRVYPEDAVERVLFIRRAKELGFTLDECRDLLTLKVAHGKSCASVRDRALAKLADIDGKMSDLERMRQALGALVDRCSGDEGTDDCTILDAIAGGEKSLAASSSRSRARRRQLGAPRPKRRA